MNCLGTRQNAFCKRVSLGLDFENISFNPCSDVWYLDFLQASCLNLGLKVIIV